MAEYIPFITGKEAIALVNEYYDDSDRVRIQLHDADRLSGLLSTRLKARIWLDPSIDGFHDIETRRGDKDRSNAWFEFMRSFESFEKIANRSYWTSPDKQEIDSLVAAVLDKCVEFNPSWITVPQIPCCGTSERNRINRMLASSTGRWKSGGGFSGRLILPIVTTNQSHTNGKTARNGVVKTARRNFHEAHADGFWIVDQSLSDDSGSHTMKTRFQGIVSLHEEVNACIPSRIRIAGPYWGLNLVLWARGLIDHPAIGVGSGYRLFLAGGHAYKPKQKIAIPSLRRRVLWEGQLGSWLDESSRRLGTSHPVAPELSAIRRKLASLGHPGTARRQVAKFYKSWFSEIASGPKVGRPMALFQDLSTAYALGRLLPDLNAEEGPARRPEAVVEPLMLNCL